MACYVIIRHGKAVRATEVCARVWKKISAAGELFLQVLRIVKFVRSTALSCFAMITANCDVFDHVISC